MKRTYMLIPVADVTKEMVDVCLQTSLSTLRRSLDGQHVILKFDSAEPTPADLVGYTQYTHDEVLIKMGEAKWTTGTR